MVRSLLLFAFLGLWLCAVTADKEPIYVSADATGTQDGSKQNPYATFKAALASPSLKNGKQILAYPGTYTGSDNYGLVISSQLALSFAVYGTGDVIIDFQGVAAGFLLVENQGLPFSVTGFTFQNQAAESATPVLSFIGTEGTLVSGCTFKVVGYGIYMDLVTEVDIEGCVFDTCYSPAQDGPALHLVNSTGVVSDSTFQSNHGHDGGAVYIDGTPSGSLSLNSVIITDNIAEQDGGGLFIEHGSVSVAESSIRNNTAKTGSGGGVYASTPVSIYSTEVLTNSAFFVGGGLAIETGILTSPDTLPNTLISTSKVNNNLASFGGGAHLASLSPVFVSASSFENNHASVHQGNQTEDMGCGGGMFVDKDGVAVTVDDSNFDDNIADHRGGGVYISGPSGSALFQMRSGSSVKGNTAEFSGGGIELDNPILFASFVDLYIEDNVVENGEGGGMMLRATCEVFHSSIAGNAASSGAGIEIDHAGFVALVDNSITGNVANQSGGGLRVGLSTGLLIKGGQFIENHAAQGGGVFLAPDLPVELASISFQNNAGRGGGIYLSGTAQSGITGLNLVKIRSCDFRDPVNQAVYCNDGEIVFDKTCNIDGLETVADSSISICGCPSAAISDLFLEADSGTLLTDSNIQAGTLNWLGGDIYGVNSTLCQSGLKTGFGPSTDYTLDSPLTIETKGKSSFGSTTSKLTSKEIKWVISDALTVNAPQLYTNDQDMTIYSSGRLTMVKSGVIHAGDVVNEGTLDLFKSSVLNATLIQSGTVEVRYTSIPEDKDAAQIAKEETKGGKLIVTAPSPTPLKEGQSFPVLKWQSYSGYFKDFDLKSDIDKGARAVLDYKPTELKCMMAQGSDGNGGLIAVIVVSVLIVIAFIGGCFLSYRLKKQGDVEEWDDGVEESKILGESGGIAEGREEQSLISNNDL